MLTGLRIGELLALRWRHVDLMIGLVRVEETVYEGRFDESKSKHSVPLIPLGPLAVAVLSDRRRQGFSDSSTLVFSSRAGSTLDRRSLLSRQLKPAAKAVELGNVTWHLLRHSNATLHDSLGTPLGTVQALPGHSSSEITRRVYLHSPPEDRRLAAETLEAHLFGPKLEIPAGPKVRFQNLLVQKK
jgi:integrase